MLIQVKYLRQVEKQWCILMTSERIIIGIDPGLRVTGYGIIRSRGEQVSYMEHGQIKSRQMTLSMKLYDIYEVLCQVIDRYQPDEAAIESIFTFHNHQAALKLGQARGVALMVTAIYGLPVAEYAARQVKQAVVGYGAASKSQIQYMVAMLLKLECSLSADAADALAIAICHAQHGRLVNRLLDQKGEGSLA